MTTDPNGWFLASQALDYHATADALADAMTAGGPEAGAYELAAELARAGFALVRVTPTQGERTEDLSPFLSRKED